MPGMDLGFTEWRTEEKRMTGGSLPEAWEKDFQSPWSSRKLTASWLCHRQNARCKPFPSSPTTSQVQDKSANSDTKLDFAASKCAS